MSSSAQTESREPPNEQEENALAENGRASELSLDEIFGVLSNERRRHAFRYLQRNCDRQVKLDELVDYITAQENDICVDAIDYKQRKRVYTTLRQTHLPKMNDCGLIDYDRDRGTIEFNDSAEEVGMYLEYVPKNVISWCYYYLGLSIVLCTILALMWMNVYPFGGLSGLAFGVIAIAAIGLTAIVHLIYTNRNEIGTRSGM